MVWKIGSVFALIGLLLLADPINAYAYDIYDSGNISTTYIEIFEDVLNSVPVSSDYVFFRSGQYTYTMVVGDFEYNNKVFSGEKYTEYTLTTSSSGYTQNTHHYNVAEGQNLNLNASNYLIYSNLGNYPTLIERGSSYDFTLLYAFVIFGLACCVRPIFQFVLRRSSGTRN